ncbi:MAG: SCO family protein [Steroidobacteraceae bacterium]|nr:SCO family protein [Steroidobacteraceae bacterium]
MRVLHRSARRRTSILLLLAIPGIGVWAPSPAAHRADGANPALMTAGPITTPGLDAEMALRASQEVVGRVPGDYTLRDRQGQPVRLSDYRGRPLLVSFIYTGCFHVCPLSTQALHKAVSAMHKRFGDRQFNVVTIGFNQPEDSPAALKAYASQQRISDPNWEFLSPDATDVAALSREFGFSYAATRGGFDHILQVTMLDAKGRIHQQIYGDSFTAERLGEPLKQLLTGARIVDGGVGITDLVDRVRILCSVYDPKSGTYRADYTLYFMIAGGVTFFIAMLWFALSEWRSRVIARRTVKRG